MRIIEVNKKKIHGKIFLLMTCILLLTFNTSYGKDVSRMELEKVTDLIMSPGCDYVYTLTNCPSAQAQQMKELIKDRLAKGESGESILAYFEDVYGPKVLAQPSKKGFYFVAWWFPYFLLFDLFLIAGVFLILWRRKSGRQETVQDAINPELETLLEDEVRRIGDGE